MIEFITNKHREERVNMGIEDKNAIIISEIRKEVPRFKEEELLEYTKIIVANLYNALISNWNTDNRKNYIGDWDVLE